MASLFDEVRAIVLNRGTRAAKIDKMVNDLKITRYEAQTFYAQLAPEMGLTTPRPVAAATPRGARRFTIGVEIECYGIDKERVRAAIEARVSLSPTTAFCLSYRAVTKQTARRPSEGFFRPSSGITASVRQILPPLLTR